MPTVSDSICHDCYMKRMEMIKTRGAWHEFIHNALNPDKEGQFRVVDKAIDLGKAIANHPESIKPLKLGRVISVSGIDYPITELKDLAPALAMNKTCKHGADPKFCKFAKSGKPCK